MEFKRGDKRALTAAELNLLDTSIIPKAREWLRLYPGLAHHAAATLQHWGEPLVDDRGKPYQDKKADAA